MSTPSTPTPATYNDIVILHNKVVTRTIFLSAWCAILTGYAIYVHARSHEAPKESLALELKYHQGKVEMTAEELQGLLIMQRQRGLSPEKVRLLFAIARLPRAVAYEGISQQFHDDKKLIGELAQDGFLIQSEGLWVMSDRGKMAVGNAVKK